MDKINKKIGKQIQKYRRLRGLTQQDFAKEIGVTEKQISKIETGVHYPKFCNFIKMLDVLGIEMKDFDTKVEVKDNSTKSSIIKIINRASEEELMCYSSIIKNIHKMYNKKRKNIE